MASTSARLGAGLFISVFLPPARMAQNPRASPEPVADTRFDCVLDVTSKGATTPLSLEEVYVHFTEFGQM
jgi:hypothetical protein